jgi:UrcA family protein
MKKQMFAAAALTAFGAALVPSAAQAETLTPITVSIQYDHALLASDIGAEAMLDNMRQQARDACTTRGAKFGRGPMVDRSCADDVVAKAAVKILKEREAKGLTTAPVFARVATVETADLGQR